MSDPAEKYRNRVDPEHEVAMQALQLAFMMLKEHRDHLRRFEASCRYMDNVGGLLDPTLYRDMLASRSFAQQKRMVDAALVFVGTIDEVMTEAKSAIKAGGVA